MRKLSLVDMQSLANERGGSCLSKKYVNANTKLVWRCSKGHEFDATPGNVKAEHGAQYVPVILHIPLMI